jgi:hypothetical protein
MISKCISGVLVLSATAMLAAQSPSRYDRTAERAISGTIKSVGSFPAVDGSVGVHIDLKTPDGLLDIRVGPAAFIGQNNFWFFADDPIVVIGAKEPQSDGAILAKAIQKGSQVLVLRTDIGVPKWKPADEGIDGCGVNHLPLVLRTTLH